MNPTSGCEIRATLPATLDAIEGFFLQLRAHCRCLMEVPDRFAAELLVREALTNAVVHGSANDPAKCVRCAVRIRHGRMTIAVDDQGDGFDWRTVGADEPSDDAYSGRGLEIFRKYATRFRFNRNGNAVTIWKRF